MRPAQTQRLATGSILIAVLIVSGCGNVAEVSAPGLARIVERDATAFPNTSIHSELLDRLSPYRVVIVGETHFIREHREFMAVLVDSLYQRGFRQLLLEWPHMADWLARDYVTAGTLYPNWTPPLSLGGDLLTAIREFNRTLPLDAQFEVRGIDVNLDDYGGSEDFRGLLDILTRNFGPREPIEEYLQRDHSTPEAQRSALEWLRKELRLQRTGSISAWSDVQYNTVQEMIEVEMASVGVRALRADRYDASVRLRENAMKRLTDLRISGYTNGTLVNVGSTHAQKKRLRGTDTEWLGDYLVHKSTAAGGSVISLAAIPARVQPADQGTIRDQLAFAPENELWRVMSQVWPGETVFLPLDDPAFMTEAIPLMFEEVVYVCAPKEHYDALMLFPLGHRVPLD